MWAIQWRGGSLESFVTKQTYTPLNADDIRMFNGIPDTVEPVRGQWVYFPTPEEFGGVPSKLTKNEVKATTIEDESSKKYFPLDALSHL